jgi:hypothetical protein
MQSDRQPKQKTTIYWTEDLYETMRRLAFERRTSINKLVVHAVETMLCEERSEPGRN